MGNLDIFIGSAVSTLVLFFPCVVLYERYRYRLEKLMPSVPTDKQAGLYLGVTFTVICVLVSILYIRK